MNIKICGITQLKQLQQLDALDVDFVGLNFYKDSPRYVVGKISHEDLKNGDFDIKKVGVFVNESLDKIMRTAEDYSLMLSSCTAMKRLPFAKDYWKKLK